MEEKKITLHEKVVIIAIIGMFLILFCKILFF
jgi:hypothetical protein